MTNVVKKISWFLTSVIIVTIAVAYICPMTMGGTMTTGTVQSLCSSDSPILTMASMPGCLGIHGGIVTEINNAIPQITNLLLVFVLLAIIHGSFSKNFVAVFFEPLFRRWRRLCLDYCTTTKALLEERILSYLVYLGNYTVASLA